MANFLVTTFEDVVDPNDDVFSLREQVAAANANPGADQILFVFPNQDIIPISLNSAIQITDDLELDAEGDLRIVGSGSERIFEFTGGGELILRDMTLEGGSAATGGGGAILSNGNVTVENVTFLDNESLGPGGHGGAISANGDLTIIGSSFINNQAVGNAAFGGAAYATGTTTVSSLVGDTGGITRTTLFQDNSTTGASGAGGALYSLGQLSLSNADFINNSTTGFGATGGAVTAQSTLIANSGSFEGNSTAGNNSGGGAIFAGGSATLNGVSFTDNLTGNSETTGSASPGGAVFVTGAANVTDTTFARNTTGADASPGGALFSGGVATISGSSFEQNGTLGAESFGGALSAAIAEISGSLFSQNTTVGIRASGGAISADTELNISTSELTNNSTSGTDAIGGAAVGGIVQIANAALQSMDNTPGDTSDDPAPISGNGTTGANANGGAIAATVSLTVDSSDFGENSTEGSGALGGALFSAGTAAVTSAVLSGNGTEGQDASGGALYAVGAATVSSATFLENTTEGDNARGGAIASADRVTLDVVNVQDNGTAGTNAPGGGVAASGDLVVTATTITGNDTENDNGRGGGLYTDGNLFVVSSTISGNTTSGTDAEGGGAYSVGNATFSNGTVAANTTAGTTSQGGGLYAGGDVTIFKSTFTGNRTDGADAEGGALYYDGSAIFGDSLFLGNLAAGALSGNEIATGVAEPTQEIRGQIIVGGGEITGDQVFAETVDLSDGISAGVLADNGGPVATVALLPQSTNPALDVGLTNLLSEPGQQVDLNGDGDTSDLISTDARGEGFDRSFDIPGVGMDTSDFGDLGAVEATEANRLPVLTPITRIVSESGAPTTVAVLDGLVDPDGNTLELLEINDMTDILGQATIDAEADTVTYDPAGNLDFLSEGEESVEEVFYTVSDGNGTIVGQLLVTVTGENDAPLAADDDRAVDATAGETTFDVVAASVIDPDANDTVVISGLSPLSIVEGDRAEFGTLAISDDATGLVFNPGADFNDLDVGETRTVQATYTVTDSELASDTGLISITVTGVEFENTPPVAANDAAGLDADDGPLTIDVLANDTDADGGSLTITSVGALSALSGSFEALGTLSIAEDNLSLVYDPGEAFDTLPINESALLQADYTVSDGQGGSATATVTITVDGVAVPNNPPLAQDDTATTETGATVLVDVLANDTDPDLDPLTVTLLTSLDPEVGTAMVTEAGGVVFRSAAEFEGLVTIDYQIDDDAPQEIAPQAIATATLEITVGPATPAPDGITLGEAQTIAYLYEAGLDRDGDIDEPGLNFWIDRLAEGVPLEAIANAFLESEEFEESFGDIEELETLEYVDLLFANVLERPGDDLGRGFWLGRLADPDFTEANALIEFAISPENLAGSPAVADLSYDTNTGDWVFA
ncbi:MAG: Ig-like domain-containing protein [Pikeienuella sp.]